MLCYVCQEQGCWKPPHNLAGTHTFYTTVFSRQNVPRPSRLQIRFPPKTQHRIKYSWVSCSVPYRQYPTRGLIVLSKMKTGVNVVKSSYSWDVAWQVSKTLRINWMSLLLFEGCIPEWGVPAKCPIVSDPWPPFWFAWTVGQTPAHQQKWAPNK